MGRLGPVPVHRQSLTRGLGVDVCGPTRQSNSSRVAALGTARSYLTVSPSNSAIDGTVTVSVEVTNISDRAAEEVVQLYLHQRSGTASRPVRELKGFERVALDAGRSRTVSFPVGPDERRYWNAAVRDWVVDASTFDVWVGGDSTASLTTTVNVG